MKTTIIIKGTHCTSCKGLIEDVSKDVPGITSCDVDFQTGKTVVEHDENLDWQAFKKEIEDLGKYTVQLPPTGFSSTDGIMFAIIAAVVGLVVIWVVTSDRNIKSKTTREIALGCTSDMATQFHIHPNLAISINGKSAEIPPNIGVYSGCMNSIHTHDAIGTLHVESPEKRDFTLSDFFAVWNKPFTQDQILDYKIDSRHQIRETVNGKPVQDFENTIMRDKDQIIIFYEEKK